MSSPSPLLQSGAIDHYENFPVASWLLPKAMRPAVIAIYRFARAADNIADEGHEEKHARLATLDEWTRQIETLTTPGASAPEPRIEALRPHVREHDLPVQLFIDLLDAFKQDVRGFDYNNHADLEDYARRSANPIGRLILRLAGVNDEISLRQSDAICSALQFINFWQDLGADLRRGRVYLPNELLQSHDLTLSETMAWALGQTPVSTAGRSLVRTLCGIARARLLQGRDLPRQLPGRLRWEIALTLSGGLTILDRIAALNYDSFTTQPRLSRRDLPTLVMTALNLPQAHTSA